MSIKVINTSPVFKDRDDYILLFDTSDFKKDKEFFIFVQIKNDSKEKIIVKDAIASIDKETGIEVNEPEGKYSFEIAPESEKVIRIPVKLNKDLSFGSYKFDTKLIYSPEGKDNQELVFTPKLNVSEDIVNSKVRFDKLIENINKKDLELIVSDTSEKDGEIKTKEKETEKEKEAEKEVEEEINEPEYNGSNEYFPENSGGNDMGIEDGNVGVQVRYKPKLIISNYKLSPEMAKAGEEFQLDLTFYNTNAEKAVRNIKITLNSQEQTESATGTRTSGSVFSPVNSSNTFYIPVIYAGDTSSKTIKLKTVPNTTAQNYTMQVQFEYEDFEGNEFTATEQIGIPVVQKKEMLYDEIKITDAQLGVPIPIAVNFYNIGKDTLSTFMVTIEGEGFENMSSRQFVGNFQPGASDSFNGEIMALQEGVLKGNVVFTYEDSTGQKHEDKVPFETEVMQHEIEEEKPSDIEELYPEENNGGFMTYLPYVGLVVLVMLIGFVVYRKKKRKKSEEELLIDED